MADIVCVNLKVEELVPIKPNSSPTLKGHSNKKFDFTIVVTILA